MRALFVVGVLAVGCAHADTVLKNAGTTLGPVLSLDCAADAGLVCQRPSTSSTGKLACATANATTIGCVIPGPQTFTGTKNFDGGLVVNGNALVDGGLEVKGSAAFDGGVYIQGILIPDGGVYTRRTIQASQFNATNGSFLGGAPTDGGTQQYLNFNDFVSGRRQAIMPASPSLSLEDGVSLPHNAHICGFYPGLIWGPAVSISGSRFYGNGQFARLSVDVLKVGAPDGGTAQDGGALQIYYAEVYNATTAAVLCRTNLIQCNTSVGTASSVCAADGGALFTSADDIELRMYTSDCLVNPVLNVCAEYAGPPP